MGKRNDKIARAKRQERAADRHKATEQFMDNYKTPEVRLLDAIFGVWEACMECGTQVLRGTDCHSLHCKILRNEPSMFYDEVTENSITVKGATMYAGIDY